MVINKPTVFIYTCQPDRMVLKEICAGMEEEGIFFEVFEKNETELSLLASQAAEDSMLGSGIGVLGMDAAFSMKWLPPRRCVGICGNGSRRALRRLGQAAARAVKRQPFDL